MIYHDLMSTLSQITTIFSPGKRKLTTPGVEEHWIRLVEMHIGINKEKSISSAHNTVNSSNRQRANQFAVYMAWLEELNSRLLRTNPGRAWNRDLQDKRPNHWCTL